MAILKQAQEKAKNRFTLSKSEKNILEKRDF